VRWRSRRRAIVRRSSASAHCDRGLATCPAL
jgi:hypothetical protein